MGKEYQIDSNIIIDYLDNKIPSKAMEMVSEIVDANPNISVITKIEVLRFNTTETAYKILDSFIGICNSLTITDAVVDKTIEICK
jgi:predicted nucleic acid-binding protein